MASANAPRFDEHIWLVEGEQKLAYEVDKKITDTGNFTILKEDHTFGNLVTNSLLEDQRVLFAGYRMPHPLENVLNIKIRTRPDYKPVNLMHHSIDNLVTEIDTLEKQLKDGIEELRNADDDAMTY